MDRRTVFDPAEERNDEEALTGRGPETARRWNALQEIASQVPEIGARFRRLARESAEAFAPLPDEL